MARQPREDDAPAVFAAYASDPEVTRYLVWKAYDRVEPLAVFLREGALNLRVSPSCGLAIAPEFINLRSMITATTCSNLAEAELLHSLLDENGIEAFVLDDAFGGVIHLQVADEQLEEAKRILREAAQSVAEEDKGDDASEADSAGGKDNRA